MPEEQDRPAGGVYLLSDDKAAREFHLVAALVRRAHELPAPPPEGRCTNVLGICVKYVCENFSREITLEDMARAAGVSKFHFLRRFRKEAGLTPGAFLQRYRIFRAMEMLAGGDSAISEISRRVGYGDAAAFSRAFLKLTGVQPFIYRQTCAKRLMAAETAAPYAHQSMDND